MGKILKCYQTKIGPGSREVFLFCILFFSWPGSTKYPIVPGHELAGVVTAVGQNVKDIKVGDNVGVGCVSDSCLECANCEASEEHACEKGRLF